MIMDKNSKNYIDKQKPQPRQGNEVITVHELSNDKTFTPPHVNLNYLNAVKNGDSNKIKSNRDGSYEEKKFSNNDETIPLIKNVHYNEKRTQNNTQHRNNHNEHYSIIKNGEMKNTRFENNNNINLNHNNTHPTLEIKKNPESEAKYVKAKLRNNRKREKEKTSVTTVSGDPNDWNLEEACREIEGTTLNGTGNSANKKTTKKDVRKTTKKNSINDENNVNYSANIKTDSFDEHQSFIPVKYNNNKSVPPQENYNGVSHYNKVFRNNNKIDRRNSTNYNQSYKNGVHKTYSKPKNDIMADKNGHNLPNDERRMNIEFLKRTWREFLKSNPMRYHAKNGNIKHRYQPTLQKVSL